ncbi:type II secretion system protein J [Fibrobacter sp.]|uniref:PulJ/GspJ family protein n=1 Tax=Fibrobacter sp. TaxID=35828 RepID=UPI00388EEDD4
MMMRKDQIQLKVVTGSRAGFTLMELIVYIAIAGIVAVLAGQAFSDSTKMRVRTESMIEANEASGEVAQLMRRDLSFIGAKNAKNVAGAAAGVAGAAGAAGAGGDNDAFTSYSEVYMDPEGGDSSSYTLTKGAPYDAITMRRLRYNDDGSYGSIEEITWRVNEKNLVRSCRTMQGTPDESCPGENGSTVTIATGVENFKIEEALPRTDGEVVHINMLPAADESNDFRFVSRFGDGNFSPVETDPVGGGPIITLRGFSTNFDRHTGRYEDNPENMKLNQVFLAEANNAEGSWQTLCKSVDLHADSAYEVSFSMPDNGENVSRMFCPGRDHMSVGFRYMENGDEVPFLKDFLFFPPTGAGDDLGVRKMRFVPSKDAEKVCLAFTFVSFSPITAAGSVRFENVKLKRVSTSAFEFNETGTVASRIKKYVKALRITFKMLVNKNGSINSFVIPIPSNGTTD